MANVSSEQLRKAIGELFIIGFNGLELSDDTSAFISQAGVGGVVLFANNYENPAQVTELINSIQECRSELPLWISVDHEGGRVQRFKKGFTRIPDAETIGKKNSPKLTFDLAEMMAKELKAVGVNVNFNPVADIMTNPKNPVIGNRAYGTNEEDVTKMTTAMIRGHLVAGVQPCVKHFPGHGDTSLDSHFALPKVDTSATVLHDRELKPFLKGFKSRCNMVMTAHIMVPALDPEFPATLSKKIIQDLLRKKMRFTRIVISDDLEMKAITDHFGAADAPRLALQAGCDLLIYRTEAAARAAYESLVKANESGKLSNDVILQAQARSHALKKEFLMPYKPAAMTELTTIVGTPANEELVKKILE
ncbi:MAG: beta-N-acetylhexosaminidase [Bdellovibrionota bacterium]